MSVTEERTSVAAPDRSEHGVRPWTIALFGVLMLALGMLVGALLGSTDDASPDPARNEVSGEPSGDAVDIAERWGEAWESGNSDAVLALYSPDVEERYIVDQTGRAVWRDIETAIDQINSVNDFDRFELVRLEEFSTSVVAEYAVQWEPEGGSPPDQSTIVVVFIGPQAGADDPGGNLIVASDIYVMPWFDIFGVDYADEFSLGNGGWVVIE